MNGMNGKMEWLKKNYMRFAWLFLAIVYGYASVHFWTKYAREDYFPKEIYISATGSIVFFVLALFRHNRHVARLEKYCSYLGLMIPPVYLMASAIFAVLTAIGWDGCWFQNESYLVCTSRIENVWRLFPTASPFHEMTYLWGKGFGNGHELYYALATAMFVTGMLMLAEIFEKQKMSMITALMTFSVIVSASEVGFYFFFTITQSRDSWPGIIISVFVLMGFLMLDWLLRRADSRETNS